MTPSTESLALIKWSKPGIIYVARNRVNGKMYIGQTTSHISDRFKTHKSDAKTNPICAFHRAIRKYGIESFEVFVIQECRSRHCLDQAEIWWIRHLGTMSPKGYNMTAGGGSCAPMSEEARKRMSERMKDPAVRARLIAGTKAYHERGVTQAHRDRMSKAMKGRKKSPEHIRKMSEVQKGKRVGPDHPCYGTKHSEETKRKMSEAAKKSMENPERRLAAGKHLIGKKFTEEEKAKLRESLKGKTLKGEAHPMFGKKWTEEHRKSHSEKMKGRPLSEERRKKLKESSMGNKSNTGRKFTEEHKRKIGEASKRNETWRYFQKGRKSSGKEGQLGLEFG